MPSGKEPRFEFRERVGRVKDNWGAGASTEVQRGDQHQRLVQQLVDAAAVGLDAHDAVVREAGGRVAQQPA